MVLYWGLAEEVKIINLFQGMKPVSENEKEEVCIKDLTPIMDYHYDLVIINFF